MKLKRITLFSVLFLLIIGFSTMQSCRKSWELDEIKNLDSEYFDLEGAVAIPLIDTEFTLGKFIPEGDSTFWIEWFASENDQIHFRMYLKDMYSTTAGSLYNLNGLPNVPANSVTFQSNTSKMKLHEKSLAGHLFFKYPELRFIIKNQIPVDGYLRLDTLRFYDYRNIEVSNSEALSFDIQAPIPGSTTVDTMLVDKYNMPGLDSIFSPIPKFVSFIGEVGSLTDQVVDNVDPNSKVSVDLDIDLIADAKLKDLVLGDTIDFPWDNIQNIEQIKSVTLKLEMTNGLPVGAYSQVYFSDRQDDGSPDDIIDSLFTDLTQTGITQYGWELRNAPVDGTGLVLENLVVPVMATIVITQEKLQKLKDYHVDKIIVITTMNSTKDGNQAEYVELYSWYTLGIRMGLMVEYEGNTSDSLGIK